MKYYDFVSNINKKDDYLHSMIRAVIFIAIVMSAMATKAQSPNQATDTNYIRNKWFVTKNAGISAGFIAFKGGSGNFVSAPLELLINRQLTNNIYAFGGVSVTPYLVRYNSTFSQPATNKNYGFMRTTNAGIYPAARAGVMYINNERTFSISGSISVSRSSYNGFSPLYAPVYAPVNPHMR